MTGAAAVPQLPAFTPCPGLQGIISVMLYIAQHHRENPQDSRPCRKLPPCLNAASWPKKPDSFFKPDLFCCCCTEEWNNQLPTTKACINHCKYHPHVQTATSEVSKITDYLVNCKWLIHSLRKVPTTERAPLVEVWAWLSSWCVVCCPDAWEHGLLHISLKHLRI